MNTRASVAGTVAVLTLFSMSESSVAARPPGVSRSAPASTPAASGERLAVGADRAAVQLLDRAVDAPTRTRYQGVQFVSNWSGAQTSSVLADVEHVPGQGTTVRLRETADSPGGSLRTSDEQPSSGSGFAASPDGAVGLLARNYAVSVAGLGAVAGRSTDVLEARRADGGVAGRFWLDQSSGLLLRREVYDGSGATVLASAFIEVTIGDAGGAETVARSSRPSYGGAAGSRSPRLASICAAGWTCPTSLADRLDLYDARQLDDPEGPVLHLSYSDGLSTVSVFQQRGRLSPRALTGYTEISCGGTSVYAHEGMERTLMWAAAGTVFTVVSDAPQDTLDRLVPQLPHEAPPPSLWERLGHGLHRVLGWFDPFD